MNELSELRTQGSLSAYTGGGMRGFVGEILNAIPLALAAPILAYQKTKGQKELLAIAIEAKRRERAEILKTMQILAENHELTPELSLQLMAAYNAQPY